MIQWNDISVRGRKNSWAQTSALCPALQDESKYPNYKVQAHNWQVGNCDTRVAKFTFMHLADDFIQSDLV